MIVSFLALDGEHATQAHTVRMHGSQRGASVGRCRGSCICFTISTLLVCMLSFFIFISPLVQLTFTRSAPLIYFRNSQDFGVNST
jgi:hypothetical protein